MTVGSYITVSVLINCNRKCLRGFARKNRLRKKKKIKRFQCILCNESWLLCCTESAKEIWRIISIVHPPPVTYPIMHNPKQCSHDYCTDPPLRISRVYGISFYFGFSKIYDTSRHLGILKVYRISLHLRFSTISRCSGTKMRLA